MNLNGTTVMMNNSGMTVSPNNTLLGRFRVELEFDIALNSLIN